MRFILLIISGCIFVCLAPAVSAGEPIEPIPQTIQYDSRKAHLGKLLFFDINLSNDRRVSCASCHDPYKGGGYEEGIDLGEHRKQRIKDATVLNSAFNFRQFWNGRARDLQEHAAMSMEIPISMGMSKKETEDRLNSDHAYKKLFREIYGRDRIQFDDVTDAIAEFEKALITPDCKFDRYLRGEIKLSPDEEEGYLLFKRLGCINCHNGINVGGNSFQRIGVIHPYNQDDKFPDIYKLTKDPLDQNKFKVPSLRNIELRAPYFHDKRYAKLEEAVKKMAYHNLGYNLKDAEANRIVAFLKTLTGKKPAILDTK